ncbi:hypothetical protein WN51_00920 [Melipona quadrifasciata]|uniref:Uncharacterized protein n=1 Tax=Melipona quadrifasciata TaxID=166423 RepID=A0A0M8ZYA9_9HYME|nr:hypothetical protein WN51_00920 [Melipona quadrifasciata]
MKSEQQVNLKLLRPLAATDASENLFRSFVVDVTRQQIVKNHNSVQFSAVQYSPIQFSAIQCSSAQFNAVQHSSVQFSTVQFSAVQCSSVQSITVQYNSVQFSTVQCSPVQFSTQLKKRNLNRKLFLLRSRSMGLRGDSTCINAPKRENRVGEFASYLNIWLKMHLDAKRQKRTIDFTLNMSHKLIARMTDLANSHKTPKLLDHFQLVKETKRVGLYKDQFQHAATVQKESSKTALNSTQRSVR